MRLLRSAGFGSLPNGIFDWLLLDLHAGRLGLTMASACVINNYWDRELDKKMERTKNRALPTNRLNPTDVLIYGIVLGISRCDGVVHSCQSSNRLAWFARIFRICRHLYDVAEAHVDMEHIHWRHLRCNASGYRLLCGQRAVDAGAWILFALLFLWQPAHFWSLAIRRVEEYRAAGFPLLPVVKGITRTKLQMVPYILLLIPTGILMFTYDYVGSFFLDYFIAWRRPLAGAYV